jgi:hypothetical protein
MAPGMLSMQPSNACRDCQKDHLYISPFDDALKDVEEAKTAELQTAEERAGEIVDLLKEMAEDKGKGKKKKLKDKTPVIRR